MFMSLVNLHMQSVINPEEYTEQKLSYALIHLDELSGHKNKGSGDTFERSHQESFIFHLYGAVDSFLQELNVYYKCNLEIDKVDRKSLKKQLKFKSPELNEIEKLFHDKSSWLYSLSEMRHHCTHRQSIPSILHIGGKEHGQTHLVNPRTNESTGMDFTIKFEEWYKQMKDFLHKLRQSAINNNNT